MCQMNDLLIPAIGSEHVPDLGLGVFDNPERYGPDRLRQSRPTAESAVIQGPRVRTDENGLPSSRHVREVNLLEASVVGGGCAGHPIDARSGYDNEAARGRAASADLLDGQSG